MRDYYHPASGHLPPGQARKSAFPPGLMKQVARGKALPPGLESKIEPFPSELERRLPSPPAGYRRALCGTFAVLIQESTSLVADLASLVRR